MIKRISTQKAKIFFILLILSTFFLLGCSSINRRIETHFYLRFTPDISFSHSDFVLIYKETEYNGRITERSEIKVNIPFDKNYKFGTLLLGRMEKQESHRINIGDFMVTDKPVEASFLNLNVQKELSGEKYFIKYANSGVEGVIDEIGGISNVLPHAFKSVTFSIPGVYYKGIIKRGPFSQGIKGIQERLVNLNYLESRDVSGELDRKTCQSIVSFQKEYNLELIECNDTKKIEKQIGKIVK